MGTSMTIDLLWALVAAAWIGLSIVRGDAGAILSWIGIVGYAMGNHVERKLKGSKYDF